MEFIHIVNILYVEYVELLSKYVSLGYEGGFKDSFESMHTFLVQVWLEH